MIPVRVEAGRSISSATGDNLGSPVFAKAHPPFLSLPFLVPFVDTEEREALLSENPGHMQCWPGK